MSKPPFRSITFPRARQWSGVAIAISLAVHAGIVAIKTGVWSRSRPLAERVVLVPIGTEGPRAVEMTYREPSGGGGARSRQRTSGVSSLPRPETGPVPEPTPTPDSIVAAIDEPTAVDSAVRVPGRPRGRARVGPAYGEGNLWVRPLPLPPQDLARAVIRTQAEIADSVVTVIVQAYLDSVLATAPDNAPLPNWTTKIGDQQLGIDSRWIYLGPIKIPTALLALILPSVSSAEMSDYTKFRQLQQMRADVQFAARRAERMDDFKRAIRELRAQREREREFAKNQRIPPPKKADSTVTNPP